MKTSMIRFTSAVVLLGSMVLVGCARSGKNNEGGSGQINSMPGQVTIAPTGATTERDAFLSTAESQFADLEHKYAKAKDRVNDASRTRVKQIGVAVDELRTSLKQLKTTTPDRFADQKAGVKAKLGATTATVEDIFAE